LFGVKPSDPMTFIVAPVILLMAALAAAYVPALRASRMDPIAALRDK
jgi:ABC-type antimicrobial peptide transport system permease subunit